MFRTTAFFALAAGIASAQLNISSQCSGALTGLIADQDAAACLSPTSLIGLTNSSAPVADTVQTWTKNVCAAAPCSNATLENVVKTVVNGCQQEITGATGDGVDPNTLAQQITPLVLQYYPTVRKIVCLKDNNENCLVQTIHNIESITGPITPGNIGSVISRAMLEGVENLPANTTCTDCTKAAYNILHTDVPSLVDDAAPALQSQCGASFTDGATPSGVSVDASTAGSNNNDNSGASPLILSGAGASALTIISAIFTLL